MPQSFRSLCFGILSPLAHCALAYSEGCGDVFLFPSLFMQFPGTHPSSFAPIFEECRFLAHPSDVWNHSDECGSNVSTGRRAATLSG